LSFTYDSQGNGHFRTDNNGTLCTGGAGQFGYLCGFNSAQLYMDEEFEGIGLHCIGSIFIWGIKDGQITDVRVYLKDGQIDSVVNGGSGYCGNINVTVTYP